MRQLDPDIRNAVRAVIIRDDQLLLLRKDGGSRGERFALPGGAQDLGETLDQALQRECLEEIGTEVEIVELLHLADYFKLRDRIPPTTRHLVEFLFSCRVPEDYVPHNGHRPDKHQVDVVWMPLRQLSAIPLTPVALGDCLARVGSGTQPVYLGVIE